MTTTYHVRGGGGLRLRVHEWGRADGPPIVFVHGWSQNHRCWSRQVDSELADEFRLIAYDLRGHGESDAPLDAAHYTDARLWADDLAAVVEHLGPAPVVLVGWSYGGFVICDYLRAYGMDRVVAIDFVAAAVKLGAAAFGTLIGPGFLDHFADATADDRPANLRGLSGMVAAFPATPYPPSLTRALLDSGMAVPAPIRAALAARDIDGADVLVALDLPVLVTHGRADTVVLPAMADHVLATCPTAKPSWYEDAGHTPHLEEPDRFNRELATLAAPEK